MLSNRYSPHFSRQEGSGALCVEQVSLVDIAKDVGTPFYVYSRRTMEEAFSSFSSALAGQKSLVCVSVKANSNLSLLALLAKKGAGFDVVSGGELERVLRAGGDAKKVVFSGVGKTDEEIRAALRAGILMFNVESGAELVRLNEIAAGLKTTAPVSLRVNPNVDAKTHKYISTGLHEHKFGIPWAEAVKVYQSWKNYPALSCVGVSCHIGSMLSDFSAFRQAFTSMREFYDAVSKEHPQMTLIDLGGGLATRYGEEEPPSVQQYAQVVKEVFSGFQGTLIFEPGRYVFSNAGVLVSSVLYRKKHQEKGFLVLDAGFNDLMRPLLYQAYHHMEPVRLNPSRPEEKVDIVGPICESGDCFAEGRVLPQVQAGEFVAIYSSGAYGFSMSSQYNSRPRVPEVLVSDGKWSVIRSRESFSLLLHDEEECLQRAFKDSR